MPFEVKVFLSRAMENVFSEAFSESAGKSSHHDLWLVMTWREALRLPEASIWTAGINARDCSFSVWWDTSLQSTVRTVLCRDKTVSCIHLAKRICAGFLLMYSAHIRTRHARRVVFLSLGTAWWEVRIRNLRDGYPVRQTTGKEGIWWATDWSMKRVLANWDGYEHAPTVTKSKIIWYYHHKDETERIFVFGSNWKNLSCDELWHEWYSRNCEKCAER